jgi:hypothetical protein
MRLVVRMEGLNGLFFTNEPEQVAENKDALEILMRNEPKNEPEPGPS